MTILREGSINPNTYIMEVLNLRNKGAYQLQLELFHILYEYDVNRFAFGHIESQSLFLTPCSNKLKGVLKARWTLATMGEDIPKQNIISKGLDMENSVQRLHKVIHIDQEKNRGKGEPWGTPL